jgi:endo-alpha-1,4-polygalactosaminidase (GH114 family)
MSLVKKTVKFVNFSKKMTSTGQEIQTTARNQNSTVRIIVQPGLIKQSGAAAQSSLVSPMRSHTTF